ncbi:MAG TPA: C1 family peptidase [Candidatus Binatus sp.]|nr:C1 family peptidase [Candidatus Binatus sp.]
MSAYRAYAVRAIMRIVSMTALAFALSAVLPPTLARSAPPAQSATAAQGERAYRPATPVHINFASNPENSVEPSVDLRPQIHERGLAVRDQGNRGTCTVFATTFLVEYQKSGMIGAQKGLDLSEEYLNWAGNKEFGKPFQDDGMFTRFMPAFQSWAITTAKDMPYRASFDPNEQPTKAAIAKADSMFPTRYQFSVLKTWDNTKGYTKAELQDVLATLRSGRPVATGMWWLSNFATVTVHGVPLLKEYPRSANTNPATEPMFDGHSIDLVGYRESSLFPGGGYFIFRNSFGPSFGEHGYGFVSFKYLLTYGNDAIAIAPPVVHPVSPPKY